MAAEKTAFLGGRELPDGALVASMGVPAGKQGVHEKLKSLGDNKNIIFISTTQFSSRRMSSLDTLPQAGTKKSPSASPC